MTASAFTLPHALFSISRTDHRDQHAPITTTRQRKI
jgi:hypothetical protein